MKKKIRFIINPISGNGRNIALKEVILKQIDKSTYEPDVCFTEHAGHATSLSTEAASNGYFAVVAVGGDGSVNEVGKGLLHSDTALGIIPRGSGNGLALHLKIPLLVKHAIDRINKGEITRIDSMRINEHICMGIAGIGFDAHVAHQFAKAGKRGLLTYCQVIFKEYGPFKTQPIEFEIDGTSFSRDAFLITFANSSQYGNKAEIAPFADIRDGELEVCILKKVPAFQTPLFAFRLFNRSSHKSSYLEIIKTKSITVKNYKGNLLHIDGEPILESAPLQIQIDPLSIKVIT